MAVDLEYTITEERLVTVPMLRDQLALERATGQTFMFLAVQQALALAAAQAEIDQLRARIAELEAKYPKA